MGWKVAGEDRTSWLLPVSTHAHIHTCLPPPLPHTLSTRTYLEDAFPHSTSCSTFAHRLQRKCESFKFPSFFFLNNFCYSFTYFSLTFSISSFDLFSSKTKQNKKQKPTMGHNSIPLVMVAVHKELFYTQTQETSCTALHIITYHRFQTAGVARASEPKTVPRVYVPYTLTLAIFLMLEYAGTHSCGQNRQPSDTILQTNATTQAKPTGRETGKRCLLR